MAESTRLAAIPSRKPNHRPASEQDQHTAERGRENLPRLRPEGHTNAELA